MANIAIIDPQVDGERNLVIKLDIEGDGATEIDEPLVEVVAFNCGRVRLDSIQGNIDVFSLDLVWDGATEAKLFTIANDTGGTANEGQSRSVDHNWTKTGGLSNPRIANWTGDVQMRTRGLGNGETASLLFHFVKVG